MIALNDADERSAAAAEYVLGTLEPADRRVFEAALGRDAALQAEVYAWQDRLLPLSAVVPGVEPASDLWARIDTSLDASRAAEVAAPPRPRSTPSQPSSLRWWQGLRFWQGLSAVAVAASVWMGVLLLGTMDRRGVEPSGARYVAVLQSPDGRTEGWLVELQAGGTLRLLPVGDTPPVPAGRALQFWTKPEGAAGPTSLGLVEAGRALVLPASSLPAVEARQLFEITLEPATGSPIGRPTGPILFVGRTVAL